MRGFRQDVGRCPGCAIQLTGHEPLDGITKQAREGDVLFCAHCGYVSVMGSNNQPRRPTELEYEEIQKDKEVQRLLLAHRASRAHTN